MLTTLLAKANKRGKAFGMLHQVHYCTLTKEYLWEATQTLAKADWDLSNWLIEQKIVNDHTDQCRIKYPQNTRWFFATTTRRA